MTSKDYLLITTAIRDARPIAHPANKPFNAGVHDAHYALDAITEALILRLMPDNSRFDAEAFRVAARYQDLY